MNPQEDIKSILNRNLAKKGLLKAAHSARVCAVADELGRDEFVSISFCDGVLKISVASAAKAHLIKLRENQIITALNERIGQKLIKKIVFKIS